ncbi:MAG TPA: hypothetical protein VGO82_09055 [Enterovirga sp.]|nr:hypothetical protein [Enterovirga sp.]
MSPIGPWTVNDEGEVASHLPFGSELGRIRAYLELIRRVRGTPAGLFV